MQSAGGADRDAPGGRRTRAARPRPVLSTRALLALTVVAGCGPPDLPAQFDLDRAVVSRHGASADTLDVPGGADTLDVAVDLAVLRGRVAWALLDPSGAEVWGGRLAEADTAAEYRALRPAPGPWQFVLRPDSAVATLAVRASAR